MTSSATSVAFFLLNQVGQNAKHSVLAGI